MKIGGTIWWCAWPSRCGLEQPCWHCGCVNEEVTPIFPNSSQFLLVPVPKITKSHILLAKRFKAELREDMARQLGAKVERTFFGDAPWQFSKLLSRWAHNAWLPGHSSCRPFGGGWAWWEAGAVRRLWRHYHKVRTVIFCGHSVVFRRVFAVWFGPQADAVQGELDRSCREEAKSSWDADQGREISEHCIQVFAGPPGYREHLEQQKD